MDSHLQKSPSQQVVSCLSRIYKMQLTTASGGNISIKDEHGNIWISPAGTDKSCLQIDDIVCVKADGSQQGRHPASSELCFHQAIYQARPDLKAVLHAHPDSLVAFSAVGKLPDVSLLTGKAAACGKLGFADYAMTGSDLLGEKIAQGFAQGADTLILENHGVVTAAEDLQTAFNQFDALVHLAEAQVYAAHLQSTSDQEIVQLVDDNWLASNESLPGTPTDQNLIEAICQYIQRACHQQLFTATSGWVAVRAGEQIIFNKHSADRACAGPADLYQVSLDDGVNTDSSGLQRTLLQIFRQHPPINVIFFAQPAHLMAFNIAGVPFNSRIIPEAYLFLRDVDCLYSIDSETISNAVSPSQPVVMIKNQGILITAGSLFQAFDRLEVAEFAAKAIIKAGKLGLIKQIDDTGISQMIDKFKLPG